MVANPETEGFTLARLAKCSPIRTAEALTPYLGVLQESTAHALDLALAGAAVADTAVLWVYAVLAALKNATTISEKLEVCARIRTLFMDLNWSEAMLVPDVFAELLRQIAALQDVDTLRVALLELCVSSYESRQTPSASGKSLTLAHCLLIRCCGQQFAQYARPHLVNGLYTKVDNHWPMTLEDSFEFFYGGAKLLALSRQFELACAYGHASLVLVPKRFDFANAILLSAYLQILSQGHVLPLPSPLFPKQQNDVAGPLIAPLESAFNDPSLKAVGRFAQILEKQAPWFAETGLQPLKEDLLMAHKAKCASDVFKVVGRTDIDALSPLALSDLEQLLSEGRLGAQVSMGQPVIVERTRQSMNTADLYRMLKLTATLTASIVDVDYIHVSHALSDSEGGDDEGMEDSSD